MVSESDSADALIFARHDNGTILWSRVISSPNNDIFTRVKLMPNGNVIAMGNFNTSRYLTNTQTSGLLACYNPNTGLLLWSNEYNTNTVNGNGEHFADIVVDENNNLYIVGGTDYIPDDVNSMVLSVDGLTGNILWQWQTNIGSSDVFRAISYHDNDLYIAGYFRRGHNNSDYYDISLTSVNRTFGTINWRSSVNINHPNINNDCSKPHDIHISSGGNILIHGTVFNDWSGTNGNHTWLLSGFIDKSSSPDVT